MTATAKYLFDRDFESHAPVADPPEVIVERELRCEFEQELERVREAEYARGRTDGNKEALQSIEAKTEDAVSRLVDDAVTILKNMGEECAAIRSQSLNLALAAAECLADELVRREPTALLESLFSECLEHLAETPHIAIRVNDELAERLQDKVTAIARERGFPGQIIVLGDPETQVGDCRIEWADGGISRSYETLRQSVTEIVERHLATRGSSGAAVAELDIGSDGDGNADSARTDAMPEEIPTTDTTVQEINHER